LARKRGQLVGQLGDPRLVVRLLRERDLLFQFGPLLLLLGRSGSPSSIRSRSLSVRAMRLDLQPVLLKPQRLLGGAVAFARSAPREASDRQLPFAARISADASSLQLVACAFGQRLAVDHLLELFDALLQVDVDQLLVDAVLFDQVAGLVAQQLQMLLALAQAPRG
jgi:hypothetical protein